MNVADSARDLRPIVIRCLYKFRFFDFLKLCQKKRVIILMYHRFSSRNEPFKIRQSVFENQIKFFKRKYNVISLQHYAELLNKSRDDCPDNPLVITIDDGYQDSYLFAYRILKKYFVSATIFLATDFINHRSWLWSNKLEYILKKSSKKYFEFKLGLKTHRFRVDSFKGWHAAQLLIFKYGCSISEEQKNHILSELALYLNVDVPVHATRDFQPLTWDQIRVMSRNDIEFGSHTCSHPILSRIDRTSLRHETIDSKFVIEKEICRDVTSFCYPNGQPDDVSTEVVNAVRESGYNCAVTTSSGINRLDCKSKYLLKRMSLISDDEIKLMRRITLSGQ